VQGYAGAGGRLLRGECLVRIKEKEAQELYPGLGSEEFREYISHTE
jgi:hypothetical protein